MTPALLFTQSCRSTAAASRFPPTVAAEFPAKFSAEFSGRLLAWWDRHGRKDLPWQQQRSAYRVWVSEIMLQQTQVTTVIPYFERFCRRFPGIQDLADASLDEVLSLWAGLGYYARARNLHRAARICRDQYNDELPDTLEALQSLPGIGRSTAAAILSQAHNQAHAILDGNVKRWLTRHRGIHGWPGKTAVLRELWQAAEALLPGRRPPDYTQAQMDLGATVCLRRKPKCGACPVSDDCYALQNDCIEQLPERRNAKPIPQRETAITIARDKHGRILLQRRPPTGIWGGLWSLPEIGPDDCAEQLGLRGKSEHVLAPFQHTFSHFRLLLQPYLLECAETATAVRSGTDLQWFAPSEWRQLGLPQPIKKLLNDLENS